jgi:hypothetical protein
MRLAPLLWLCVLPAGRRAGAAAPVFAIRRGLREVPAKAGTDRAGARPPARGLRVAPGFPGDFMRYS